MSSNTEKVMLVTPVGRIVQGDVFAGQTKDSEGRLLTVKTGPNAGQPTTRYFIALAIAKTDPGWPAFHQAVHNAAIAAFPTLFKNGQCLNPQFAFKITDGDSETPNTKGVKPNTREGFPGHWVVSFTNGFAPKCYTQGGGAIITNPAEVKRGDYVRVYAEIKGNESMQQPGMFINHSMVEHCGYGDAILSGPTGADVFGSAPSATPAGMSATPLAPAATMSAPALAAPRGVDPGSGIPAIPATPPPQGFSSMAPPPAATPAPVAAPVATPTPAPSVQPAPDFLNPPTPAAAPAIHQMTPAANGITYEQYLASGWTDEQLRSHGYMV